MAGKGIPEELDGIGYLPEPSDHRILSAVDPSISGWQEDFRSKVVGWEPHKPPLTQAPRGRQNRTIGVWVVLAIFIALFLLLDYQQPITKLTYPDSEWAWEDSGIRELQNSNLSGQGVNVCIVDTGVDISHPDLQSVQIHFKDFVGTSTTAVDYGDSNHGTMMVGILVADGHISGAAPNVTLSVAAALQSDTDGENSGDEETVAAAIDWCWQEQDADIISLSLGGDAMSGGKSTYSAVERALAAGTYVIAAAGNDGGSDDDGYVATPANVPLAIAVGAVNEDGRLWNASSQGNQQLDSGLRLSPNEKPEVVAPGVEIISTGRDNTYFRSSGTSDATVFVTGALALILEQHNELLPAQSSGSSCIELVKDALMNSSAHLTGQVMPHDDGAGYGALDSSAWLAEISATLPCDQ